MLCRPGSAPSTFQNIHYMSNKYSKFQLKQNSLCPCTFDVYHEYAHRFSDILYIPYPCAASMLLDKFIFYTHCI